MLLVIMKYTLHYIRDLPLSRGSHTFNRSKRALLFVSARPFFIRNHNAFVLFVFILTRIVKIRLRSLPILYYLELSQ